MLENVAPGRETSVIVNLTVREARALAQLVKRLGWAELELNAVDREEADLMRDALERLRRGLLDSGFDPR